MDNCKKHDIDCSIVVPLYNETRVVDELHSRLTKTMSQSGLHYELVLVDDGSSDGTLQRLKNIAYKDSRVVIVELRRNFGQTSALAAGFDIARGKVIVSMDGDLQHDPEEIPHFLEKIGAGYDVVSGWRKWRNDSLLMRRIPSRVANWLASRISGVRVHDFGTTFKAYRREVLEQLNLYGEMHRFIPAVASCIGIKVAEIPIRNCVRLQGHSNYGISRTFRVALDLITLKFVLSYFTRPLHFFGKIALYLILTSVLLSSYAMYDKLTFHVPILVAHGPLVGLAGVLLLVGFILMVTGLIGEMVSRVYFESTGKKIYSVRRIYSRRRLTIEGKHEESTIKPVGKVKKGKLILRVIIVLLIIGAAVLLIRHFDIEAFSVIEPGILYASGQPRGMDYTRLLYNYRIATIVNVRSVSERREKNWYNEEVIWVRSNRVDYIELPIEEDNNIPDSQVRDKFRAVMADENNLPVLVHGSGHDKRVAMLVAVWLRKDQHCTLTEAITIIGTITNDLELTEAEIQFIKNLLR